MTALTTVAKNAVRGIQAKSPVILTGLAVAGVASTVILAVRATTIAVPRLAEAEDAEGRKATTKEKIQLLWPLYLPPVVTGISTVACIIGAQSINSRRQAALIGAVTITESAFSEYREQVVEALGKGKEEKVRDAVVQQRINDNPPDGIVVIGEGNVLCFDTYTGRYFESTMEKIRGAVNDFNEGLLNGEMYMSVNEFYHMIGLQDVVVGEQVGFSPENLLKMDYSTALSPDGRPCLAITFHALPRQDYFKFQ